MKSILAAAMLLMAAPSAAEVASASSNGFEVRETTTVNVPPDAAFAGFSRIGSWWSGEHSFSGSASNLSLALEPGGCFCERLANGGGVQHMHVAYAEPGKRVVLTGSLGPLLFLATSGVMDVQFEPVEGGTRVTLDYRAAGFFAGGADKIAPAVDSVLGEQLMRFKAHLSRTP